MILSSNGLNKLNLQTIKSMTRQISQLYALKKKKLVEFIVPA